MPTNNGDIRPSEDTPRWARWLRRVIQGLLILVILGVSGGISFHWLTNKPKATRHRPEAQAKLVEVVPVRSHTETVVVHAMGTVIPARTVQLASQVSGEIVDVSVKFVPGERFDAGESMLKIDPRDYKLVVEQRSGDLAKAECDLKVEMGQQSVARREYELLSEHVQKEDEELILRRPQLAMAEAAVAAMKASLDKAKLDLQRTNVTSPFNAMIQSRSVNLGSHVNVGTVLASLVGTDEYWVEVLVPVDELKWIGIPGFNAAEGATVRVYHVSAWGADVFREGKVERLMTDLEPQGRMARLLVTVKDPLELQARASIRRPLILGSYVRVAVDGRKLADIVRVSRTALRDGDHVWVMLPDSTLDIRKVTIVWGGNNDVYVSEGLVDGDLLITSDLVAPVQGMALRTLDDSEAKQPIDGLVPDTRPESRS